MTRITTYKTHSTGGLPVVTGPLTSTVAMVITEPSQMICVDSVMAILRLANAVFSNSHDDSSGLANFNELKTKSRREARMGKKWE